MSPTSPNKNDGHHDDHHWNFGGGAGSDPSCWGKDSHHDGQYGQHDQYGQHGQYGQHDQYDQYDQHNDHCAGFDGHDAVVLGLVF